RMRRSFAFRSSYPGLDVRRDVSDLSHLIGPNVHLSLSNRISLNGTERVSAPAGLWGPTGLARVRGLAGPAGPCAPARPAGPAGPRSPATPKRPLHSRTSAD